MRCKLAFRSSAMEPPAFSELKAPHRETWKEHSAVPREDTAIRMAAAVSSQANGFFSGVSVMEVPQHPQRSQGEDGVCRCTPFTLLTLERDEMGRRATPR